MQHLADPPAHSVGATVDLTGYVKSSELGNYATKEDLTKKGEIQAVFDPLPVPAPLPQQPTIANLGSVVANVVGTQMVNGGKVHSFGRTSTPPQLTWDTTFNISPASTPCKLRFAVANSRQSITGGVEVSINGAAPLTASNTSNAWSSSNQALVAYQDGAWTWFDVAIPAQAAVIPVRVQLPTGQGAIPTLYAAESITNLKPSNPTALVLRAFPDGESLTFRPSELAKKSELPSLIPLTNRVIDLEQRPSVTPDGIVAWSAELNLTTQLNSLHPSGGLMKEFVTDGDYHAIALTIGNGVTAAALKTELEVPATDRVARVKSGTMDTLITGTIPSGLYWVYRVGDLLRMIVIDSAG